MFVLLVPFNFARCVLTASRYARCQLPPWAINVVENRRAADEIQQAAEGPRRNGPLREVAE